MSQPSLKRTTALGLVALLFVTLVPPFAAQANALCEDPDGDDVAAQVERGYDDLIVRATSATLTPTSGDPVALSRTGVHFLTDHFGSVKLDLDVANVGHGTGDPSGDVTVRASLAQPNGVGVVRSVDVAAPARGENASASLTLDLVQPGRHTLQLHVNPGRTLEEACDDGSNPNPACENDNGLPSPCRFEYYGNNTMAYGFLVVERPDLVVSQIHTTGPVRATNGPHADSEVVVHATIQNVGEIAAYHLGSVVPGARQVPVQLTVKDCTCTAATAQFGQLAPGAATTVRATLKAHGLAGALEATARVDPAADGLPHGIVAESDEENNARTDSFGLPTADLSVSVTTDLQTEDGRVILPKGRPLEMSINVQNSGDATAATTQGGEFQVEAFRDSPANRILLERLVLDSHATVTYGLVEEIENLTGTHDFTISVDGPDGVLETNEGNNDYVLRVTVAVFEAELGLTEATANPTVPPGTTGKVPFELTNKGTVTDTYTFSAPAGDQGAVSHADAAGRAIRDIELGPGDTFKGELRYEIPSAAAKGDTFPTRLIATSEGSGNTTTRNLTFTVGDDTVPPTISMHDPESGHLSGNRLVIRVTDNVDVNRVETDVGGSFQSVSPDAPGGNLYTIDVTGRAVSFKLNVRATDPAGNEVTEGFDLVRDTTAPRIVDVSFTPARGVVPGTKINVVVDARDENMDHVKTVLRQPRPDGLYTESHTLVATNINHQLRDWIVPERPGHYIFNVTATDKAGNTAFVEDTLYVNGLDLRVGGSDRPIVTPPRPNDGDNVRLTWRIQNTNPIFSSGPFFVALGTDREGVADDAQIIGRQRIDLAPGEVRPVTFIWPATEGRTFFALIIDERLQVAEDTEDNNLVSHSTDTLFPDQGLFATSAEEVGGLGFTQRLVDYWFVPTLFIATVVLFVIALALGRRTVPA